MRGKFYLLLALLFFSITCLAAEYPKLNDANVKHQAEFSEVYRNNGREYKVKYNVYYQEHASDMKLLVHSLNNGTKTVFEFAEKNNLPVHDCRSKENVGVYWISFNTLNDESKFYSWKSQNSDVTDIVAMYDPINAYSSYAVILLTEQGRRENEATIVHEVGHYWYDRFCWERSWIGGSTESFAQALEKYYIYNEM